MNTVGPVRASIGDATYDSLRDGIAAGRFPPGSRLPSERALSEGMGVSPDSKYTVATSGSTSMAHVIDNATRITTYQY